MYCSNCGKKLKDNIYTCSKCGFESPNPKKHSNKISIGKFIFYTILSLGIYPLVWIYRTWKFLKQKGNLDISPFWRTFFTVIFMYSLLKRVKALAQEEGINAKFSPGWRAFFYFIIASSENSYNRKSPDSAFPIIISFLLLLKPISVMNNYYEKTEENTIERPTEWWHYILIFLGIISWIGILLNLGS